MKFLISTNGQDHTLEIVEKGRLYRFDGSPFEAEVAKLNPGVYSLLIGGKSFLARVVSSEVASNSAGINPAGSAIDLIVVIDGSHYAVSVQDPRRRVRVGPAKLSPEGKRNVSSVMPGKVIKVLVSEGQVVQQGQGLVVVEAMKMQNEIKCPKAGKVQKLLVREGQAVNAGEILLTVE